MADSLFIKCAKQRKKGLAVRTLSVPVIGHGQQVLDVKQTRKFDPLQTVTVFCHGTKRPLI